MSLRPQLTPPDPPAFTLGGSPSLDELKSDARFFRLYVYACKCYLGSHHDSRWQPPPIPLGELNGVRIIRKFRGCNPKDRSDIDFTVKSLNPDSPPLITKAPKGKKPLKIDYYELYDGLLSDSQLHWFADRINWCVKITGGGGDIRDGGWTYFHFEYDDAKFWFVKIRINWKNQVEEEAQAYFAEPEDNNK